MEPDDEAYLQAVFQQTCETRVSSSTGIISEASKVQLYYRRRALVNGRLRRRGCFEHWCPSRQCRESPEHGLEQVLSLVSEEYGPKQWCSSRWVGVEDPCDWALFWMTAHGVLQTAILEEMQGNQPAGSASDQPGPGQDPWDLLALEDHEHLHPEEREPAAANSAEAEGDVGLQEPLKEDSIEERQKPSRATWSSGS